MNFANPQSQARWQEMHPGQECILCESWIRRAWNWLFEPSSTENDRAQQAQKLADEGVLTQAEADSQKASTYRHGLQEGVVTVGSELTEGLVISAASVGIIRLSGGIWKFVGKHWYPSTSNTAKKAAIYHWSTHGGGQDIVQYTRDAVAFYKENKNLAQERVLEDGTIGVLIRKGTQGGYYKPDGRVVSFWYD